LTISESSGPPDPVTIRWTGSDFEGWTGTKWLSFTTGSKVADGSGNAKALKEMVIHNLDLILVWMKQVCQEGNYIQL
jgi:hypothetical protein